MARVTRQYFFNGPQSQDLQNVSTGNPILLSSAVHSEYLVEVDSTDTDSLDDALRAMGFLPGRGSSIGGIIIFWTTEPWSEIKNQIDAVPASNGVIVMVGAGAYTMDVAANLDRVQFVGMVESPTEFGGTPTTITMTGAFALLGNFLYLVNIVALSEVTIWDGVGPFRLNLMGSSDLSRSYLGTFVPTIKLAAGGILNVSASQLSLFAGGNDPTVEMDDGSTINFILTGSGIMGDKTAVLKGGATAAAVTAGIDATSVVAGQNGAFGNALGAGITLNTYKNGNAFFGPYSPTTTTDWNAPVPDNIGDALDQCAARLRAGAL